MSRVVKFTKFGWLNMFLALNSQNRLNILMMLKNEGEKTEHEISEKFEYAKINFKYCITSYDFESIGSNSEDILNHLHKVSRKEGIDLNEAVKNTFQTLEEKVG